MHAQVGYATFEPLPRQSIQNSTPLQLPHRLQSHVELCIEALVLVVRVIICHHISTCLCMHSQKGKHTAGLV